MTHGACSRAAHQDLTPYRLPKKMQQKQHIPDGEKNLQRITTDSSDTVTEQKEKGKRSIWSETTTSTVRCWPFTGPPVQDAWGRASAPRRGRPVYDTAEDQALSVLLPQQQVAVLPETQGSVCCH